MADIAVQDLYEDAIAICYGCGKNNEHGLHIRTFWDGEAGIAHFTPKPYHTAFPGYVYGGLLASLVDCHMLGTAIAAAYDAEGREVGSKPTLTYVTGNLNVSYVDRTPMGVELTLRSKVTEMHERKAIVTCSVFADGKETVKAEMVAVKVSSRLFEQPNE